MSLCIACREPGCDSYACRPRVGDVVRLKGGSTSLNVVEVNRLPYGGGIASESITSLKVAWIGYNSNAPYEATWPIECFKPDDPRKTWGKA